MKDYLHLAIQKDNLRIQYSILEKKIEQMQGIENNERSRMKRKCKLQSMKSFQKQTRFIQKPKQILSQILQMDYVKQIKPQQIKTSQIQTYGALAESEVRQIFQKQITKQTLKLIIIDAMKLCYLYHPIMNVLQTQLSSQKQEYLAKDVLQLIMKGNFYQFLMLKTQPTKFLVNNRSTEVNVKTIISGVLTFLSNKLTIQNISDVILFYRLQEALYETAPFGLPFQFEKIIKAMKKIDRNITAQKFNKWERKMNAIQKDIKFLQPYHFVYLISLSEPVSKKKTNIFQVDKKQSKFQKQAQMMNIMKEKNNFINLEKRRTNWKCQIKVRGLSFQQPSQAKKLVDQNKKFDDLRRRIISHKRVKSAHISNEAKSLVKKDLKDMNLKENQYFLDTCFFKPNPNKQRKLLKKHLDVSRVRKQFQNKRRQQKQKFDSIYNDELNNHLALQEVQRPSNKTLFKIKSNVDVHSLLKQDEEEVIDIYSHHLMRILVNTNCKGFFDKTKNHSEIDLKQKMLMWL